ncbi:hypothetical protein PXC01_18380 [Maribacter sp. M208]|uniref:hypothetical protein n=1 Tax=Maribacter huludaoensis TaxID=3030010 RepID=UPI0023EDCF54|nr:hypothetical protein [Maribacter huludaoensis]MDF4223570.1 hypothetical protein [Maribacter huludaoensis]
MDKNKNYVVTFIIGILGFFIALWLLVQGRFLIGIFGGITCIQLLKNGIKKTNANNG